ncbi:MAG: hypothetical protein ABIO42_06695 [Burkholderiaceae bacterium]
MQQTQMSLELATAPAAAVPTVGLFFGGRSAEHEVSIRSAASLHAALCAAGYWVVPIGIQRCGAWRYMPLGNAPFPTGVDPSACGVTLAPGGAGQLMARSTSDLAVDLPRIDVAFPALHGPFGEDGCIQGLFETCAIPHIGAGVLASAVTMDKEATKRLLLQAGLPVVPYRLHRRGKALPTYDRLRESLGPRLFINEVNTLPGFTPASLFARMLDATGIPIQHQVRRLVDLALART